MNALFHHVARPLSVVIAHLELEGRLRHAVRILVALLEDDFVLLPGLDIAEETVVDDEASVDVFCDCAVREGVAVDLTA